MVLPLSLLGIKLPDKECVRLALKENRLDHGWAMPVANDVITRVKGAYSMYTSDRGADISGLLDGVPKEVELFINLVKKYSDQAEASKEFAKNALDNDEVLIEKCKSALSSLQLTTDKLKASIEGDKEAMQQAQSQVENIKKSILDVERQLRAEKERHATEAAWAWTGIGALVLAADHAISAIVGKRNMLEQVLKNEKAHGNEAMAEEERVQHELDVTQNKLNDAYKQLQDDVGRRRSLEEHITSMSHQVATSDALGSSLSQLSAFLKGIDDNVDSIRTAETYLTSEVTVVSPTNKRTVGVEFKVALLALAIAYDKDQSGSYVLGDSFSQALGV